jgi:hypothetical protein
LVELALAELSLAELTWEGAGPGIGAAKAGEARGAARARLNPMLQREGESNRTTARAGSRVKIGHELPPCRQFRLEI